VPVDLAVLLVEAGAASAEAMARAAARQREVGGALDSALLELGVLRESELLDFLCRTSGLPPAPLGPIEVDPRARRLFPGRVAERYGLAPFQLNGRELSLLATYPVDMAALDEISFMLSLHLLPHVAPEWRVREHAARVYGGALPERFVAIARAVRGGASGVGEPSAEGQQQAEEWAAVPAAAALPAEEASGEGGTDEALAISLEEEVSFSLLDEESPPDETARAQPLVVTQPVAPAPAQPPSKEPPEATEIQEPLAGALAQAVGVGEEEALIEDEEAAPVGRGSSPPRWSRQEALAALERARCRDDVVGVALRYARDFFEAVALFAVTREWVSGHDALGWENARVCCRSVRVSPEAVGLFRMVVETKGPYLGPIAPEPGNVEFLNALGRGLPRIALAYPVVLRNRIACVLYGDNGEAPVSPQRLGDLLLLASALPLAFERVLHEAKRIRSLGPPLGTESGAAPLPEALAVEPSPDKEQGEGAGVALAAAGWRTNEPANAENLFDREVPSAPPPSAGPSISQLDDLVRLLVESAPGSPERARFIVDLVRRGPEAAAALCLVLPGPLDAQGGAEPQAVEERGPVLAALAALGIVATPYLAKLLVDDDAERSRLAALLLGRLGDAASFLPLADAVMASTSPRAAEAALAALAGSRKHQEFRPVLERFRRALLGSKPEWMAQAARALGRLGDEEAIPLLIQALDAPEPVCGAGAAALSALSGRRFGLDQAAWLAWWRDHRGKSRVDWLFEALLDDDPAARLGAAQALREGGAPPVDWLNDAPRSERLAAARTWRAWWDEQRRSL